MIKCLYVNGDSFSFGAELDDPNGTIQWDKFDNYRRKHCFSGIIADKYNFLNYYNNAQPGGSNERIYRTLIKDILSKLEIYKPEEIFCLIGLTDPGRREFCIGDDGSYMLYIPHFQPTPYNSYLRDLWELFIKHYSYDHGIYTFNHMIVLGIQNFLRTLKIPYLLTYSMPGYSDNEKKYISLAQNNLYYLKRIIKYPSFMLYNNTNGWPVGSEKHPLEEGHRQWASFLIDYIEKENLFDNSDL